MFWLRVLVVKEPFLLQCLRELSEWIDMIRDKPILLDVRHLPSPFEVRARIDL